ncbi:unnamed protein product [Prorocentrum cordatum]|uniref:FAD-binding domain-containing protein n=1 Tax=Prorocentrum cordatum TaxID=2364126 RepID=A0ABN9SXI4_9DINO|nr:unnamed protein product [Polarella glacialis]
MRVAVVGGGPGGLCAAIGLGQLGHDVVVLERLEHPSARPSRSRQRSYPVDISGGGMAALEALGAAPEGGALRRRLLPFLGHAAEPGGRAPRPMRSPGLIGTREDLVEGKTEERGGRWAGRVRVFHGVEVGRLDLAARTVEVVGAVGCDLGEAAAAAQQPFDLICACDGTPGDQKRSWKAAIPSAGDAEHPPAPAPAIRRGARENTGGHGEHFDP